jgi:hypothetical protein
MTNVFPFPRTGGSNHHGAGGFNHHGSSLEYWWEVPEGSIVLPLFYGMPRKEVGNFVDKLSVPQSVFESLLPAEACETLMNDLPAELFLPENALLCCGDGKSVWVKQKRKWREFPLTAFSE